MTERRYFDISHFRSPYQGQPVGGLGAYYAETSAPVGVQSAPEHYQRVPIPKDEISQYRAPYKTSLTGLGEDMIVEELEPETLVAKRWPTAEQFVSGNVPTTSTWGHGFPASRDASEYSGYGGAWPNDGGFAVHGGIGAGDPAAASLSDTVSAAMSAAGTLGPVLILSVVGLGAGLGALAGGHGRRGTGALIGGIGLPVGLFVIAVGGVVGGLASVASSMKKSA